MNHPLREHIEKVIPLRDEEFKLILGHFSTKKFKKHQFLIQEGEPAKYNFFVLSGLLKLVFTESSGKQHIVAFAMEDWWESDFFAWYTGAPATMSLECLEDTEVLCITLDDYHALCNSLQKIERFFLEKSIFGFVSAQRRILAMLTSSAQERYERLLKQYPSLVQRVPKTQLAAFLGVSRETLSRFSG
ncbi:Crp/Fnr family transcriptional regulator [Pedobacter sp. JY14-1]|uniref:Crp/Fnr family transcriptional regulator n=1 Tax=Pedobacter sp. JY14-1 TaxID=3034151 RepID=UPI0023E16FE9|nr:Crp/Fnr family transcriptional regulator [Pedobacter sp. JY14-1]